MVYSVIIKENLGHSEDLREENKFIFKRIQKILSDQTEYPGAVIISASYTNPVDPDLSVNFELALTNAASSQYPFNTFGDDEGLSYPLVVVSHKS